MPDVPPLSGCCAYYYYYLSCTHIYSPTKCWLLLLLRWITASDGNNFRKSSPRLQMITALIYLLSWDQHWTHPSLTSSQAFRRQPASSARLDVLDNNARIVLSRNRNNIIIITTQPLQSSCPLLHNCPRCCLLNGSVCLQVNRKPYSDRVPLSIQYSPCNAEKYRRYYIEWDWVGVRAEHGMSADWWLLVSEGGNKRRRIDQRSDCCDVARMIMRFSFVRRILPRTPNNGCAGHRVIIDWTPDIYWCTYGG